MDIRLVTSADISATNPVEGDLYLSPANGDLAWITGPDAVAQHIRIRLRFFSGEWFLNTDEGILYFQEILEKGTSNQRIESILRQVVLNTPGVAGLNFFSLSRDNASRVLTVNFEAVLDTGAILKSSDYAAPFTVG